ALNPVEEMQALVEAAAARLSDAALQAETQLLKLYGLSAAQLARELRGDLDNIVGKALQKEPADRYPTADAFARELKRYLNHEPVIARPESRAYRMRKFVRRHRLAVGFVASIVVVLIAGIAGTTWQAIEAKGQRDVAR